MNRARGCCAFGSFWVAIEMKITLSTPSTISSTVSVRKLTHTAGSVSSSSIGSLGSLLFPPLGKRDRLSQPRPPGFQPPAPRNSAASASSRPASSVATISAAIREKVIPLPP